MSIPSLFVMILLMLTGASPGGTGGGIKTTTLGALFLSIKAQLTGQSDANFLKRRIPEEMIRKSFSIFFLFSAVMITDLMVLATVEKTPFLSVLFEAASALGNTGLSIGITSHLAGISKAALSLTMFIGRVGPLTIGLALIGKKKRALFSYADGEVYVG
jgi:trk system potassium uptake protein TrkH